MERMEHIRGKILEGEQTVLDPVDGYLACHEQRAARRSMATSRCRPNS